MLNSIIIDIHITPAVIKRGTPRDGCDCPVAIAVIEALRARGYNPSMIEVDSAAFAVYMLGELYEAKPTNYQNEVINGFMNEFDEEEGKYKVMPFSIRNLKIERYVAEYDGYEE